MVVIEVNIDMSKSVKFPKQKALEGRSEVFWGAGSGSVGGKAMGQKDGQAKDIDRQRITLKT